MHPGKIMDEIDDHKIEDRDESAEQQHRYNHDDRRIGQFLVTPDAFVLRFPRPRGFPQLGPDFAEEIFCFRDHESFKKPGQEGLEPPTDGFGDRYSTN